MGAAEIEAFLTHLAVQQKVAASTQNQALSALLFLYRDVLRQAVYRPIDAIRARKPTGVPTVLTKEEALQVLESLSGTYALWPSCSTALACDRWSVCGCGSKIATLPNGRSSYGMAKVWKIRDDAA